MKAVILAGGMGTRLSTATDPTPKPLVKVGEHPIIWHVMQTYASQGIRHFIVCLGYGATEIREYFLNYFLSRSDLTVDVGTGEVKVHSSPKSDFKVTLVDTGLKTATGGRLKRIAPYLEKDEVFCMTYADGLSDIDVSALVRHHQEQARLVTVTVVRPLRLFGRVRLNGFKVDAFEEKPPPRGDEWISGGYFVISRRALDYIESDSTVWERQPMSALAAEGQVSAYLHEGFWHCMDTRQQQKALEQLWRSGEAPWKPSEASRDVAG